MDLEVVLEEAILVEEEVESLETRDLEDSETVGEVFNLLSALLVNQRCSVFHYFVLIISDKKKGDFNLILTVQ